MFANRKTNKHSKNRHFRALIIQFPVVFWEQINSSSDIYYKGSHNMPVAGLIIYQHRLQVKVLWSNLITNLVDET